VRGALPHGLSGVTAARDRARAGSAGALLAVTSSLPPGTRAAPRCRFACVPCALPFSRPAAHDHMGSEARPLASKSSGGLHGRVRTRPTFTHGHFAASSPCRTEAGKGKGRRSDQDHPAGSPDRALDHHQPSSGSYACRVSWERVVRTPPIRQPCRTPLNNPPGEKSRWPGDAGLALGFPVDCAQALIRAAHYVRLIPCLARAVTSMISRRPTKVER